MAKFVNRYPVEVNINSPKQDHIPIFDETLRLWNTVTASAILSTIELDKISGSRFAERDYTFPNNLLVEGNLTASNLKVLYTASTELLGIGTRTPKYPLDVNKTGSTGIHSLIGDDILSGVTVWDGTYQAQHPLRQKLVSLDSSLFTVVNRKPYGSVLDDEYYQFVNYLELTSYGSNDEENVYAHINYIDYSSSFSQSSAIYTFANSEENSAGYLSSVFTNYNISRTTGQTATTNNVSTVLGWIQAENKGLVNNAYAYRAQANVVSQGIIDKYYMFYGNTSIQNYGKINTLRGIYVTTDGIQSGSFSGSIGDYAGINIIQGTITGSNNTLLLIGSASIPAGNYAIYNTSPYSNFIEGSVGIGTQPISGSKLIVNGKISASQFEGDGSLITGLSTLNIDTNSGSVILDLKTETLFIEGIGGMITSASGNSVFILPPDGLISSSAQVDLDGGLYDGGF